MNKQTKKGYNGHKNHAQWNQSLWINNDEGLYRLALECIENNGTRAGAVENFLDVLKMEEITRTPDGVKWSKAGIRAAMVGL